MVRESVVEQFSYHGDAGAIWRAFDLVLDTNGYLNLGYSTGHQTHTVGAPQRRLVHHVCDHLADSGVGSGEHLLDIGCGRGGPAAVLVDRLEVDAVAAIDSLVYVDALEEAVGELRQVLATDGVAVITDLVVKDGGDPMRAELVQFAEQWGFPPLRRRSTYQSIIETAGFEVTTLEDLTGNSVGRFGSWTSRYQRLRRLPTDGVLDRVAGQFELDLEAIDRQVDAAHEALPHLEHVLVVIAAD